MSTWVYKHPLHHSSLSESSVRPGLGSVALDHGFLNNFSFSSFVFSVFPQTVPSLDLL